MLTKYFIIIIIIMKLICVFYIPCVYPTLPYYSAHVPLSVISKEYKLSAKVQQIKKRIATIKSEHGCVLEGK